MLRTRIATWTLVVLACVGLVLVALVAAVILLGERNPDKRAIICMALGLVILWCILGGVLMRLGRDRFVSLMARVRIPWQIKFVVLCIVMALLEEAVTVSMTNLGPRFGAVSDAAHIAASKSYLETVCLDSVIIFVPQFMCWPSSCGSGTSSQSR